MPPNRGSRARDDCRWPAATAAAGALLALACALAILAVPASAAKLRGQLESGGEPLGGVRVKAYRSGGADGATKPLAAATSARDGGFRLRIRPPRRAGSFVYLTAGKGAGIQLAATLGPPPLPRKVVVNELTTAASGYALAQFIRGRRVAGPRPGPQNAALMAANLADPRKGKVAGVLRSSPNGGETSTLATFKSVANMLQRCSRSLARCDRLFRLAATPDGRRPRGTIQAVSNIARNPWQNTGRLFRLAGDAPDPYRGALSQTERPAAWTMPVRFAGDGMTLDGPGNTAFDAEGNAYIANNYEYGADPFAPVCGSDLLPKFAPDGSFAEGSPYEGGGLSGAGYGVTLDPEGDIWVGNYGFAAPPPGCPADRQPLHNSVSQFRADGTPVSPSAGWVGGGLDWPQGTVSDQRGTIWAANCGNGLVTRLPGDAPGAAVGVDAGLEKAFDVAVNHAGEVFVTGIGNSRLAILGPDGTPRPGSPLSSVAAGLDRPMGIAADSGGNMWIANSGLIDLPCPGPVDIDFASRGGSLSLVAADGTPLTSDGDVFEGGGLTIPWGIAVDGEDNVWVSNFGQQRVSEFCGLRVRGCRPGAEPGDPISPEGTGYFFDGFVRLTSVQIDPSGNVWVTNNWKLKPVQANPGGYEMVVLVGAAAPLRAPLIGPPDPLLG